MCAQRNTDRPSKSSSILVIICKKSHTTSRCGSIERKQGSNTAKVATTTTTTTPIMGFLDNIFKDDKGKGGGGGKGGGVPNPFANLGGGKKAFKGQGNSLGGSKPGEVISVTLPHPGPLGVRVEKKTNNDASAVVNQVVPGSQAEAAGLQRGDVLCYAGTNGQEEIMYDIFLQLARSEQRPIRKYSPMENGGLFWKLQI